MKRTRDENISHESSEKKNISGKLLYHCRFSSCNFIACTEHNIEHHMKFKHVDKTSMSDKK